MILVTGGYGCIGAETIKWLLKNTSDEVLLASRTICEERTERVFHDVDRSKLSTLELEVSDQDQLQEVFSNHPISRVVHLAALQTPACNAHRDLGMQVNLGATQKMLECIKASVPNLKRFVFASSIAVYGPRISYPQERVPETARPKPVNVYGVWKLASEQLCDFFHHDTGIPTLSLRPGVLYGPGRDVGLTSTPTMAMKCLALGKSYQIPFRNRQDYLYAPDAGAAFGHALTDDFDGHGIFTLPSHTVEMVEFVATMRAVAEELGLSEQFAIGFGVDEVPFICDIEYNQFRAAFPNAPHTSLRDGVMESLQVFQKQVEQGWLTSESIG